MNGNAVSEGIRITHGFQIHCNPDIEPQNLEVNWRPPDGKESHFHLLDMNPPTHCLDTAIIQAAETRRLTRSLASAKAASPAKSMVRHITIIPVSRSFSRLPMADLRGASPASMTRRST